MVVGKTSNYGRTFCLLIFMAIFAFARASIPSSVMIMNGYINPLLSSFVKKNQNFNVFLSGQNGIEIPREMFIGQDFNELPLPPNPDLLDPIQSTSDSFGPPPFRLLWMGKEHFGGVYYTIGSGACQNWTMFQSDGHHLIPADPPDIFEPYVCGNDGGRFGHETFIAEIGNQVVAIKDGVEQTDSGALKFHVYLQVWNGSSWDAPADTIIDVNFGK